MGGIKKSREIPIPVPPQAAKSGGTRFVHTAPPCGPSGILALFPGSRPQASPTPAGSHSLRGGRENGRNPFSQFSLVFKTQRLSGIDVSAIPWGFFPLFFRIRARRRLAEEIGLNLHVLVASGGGVAGTAAGFAAGFVFILSSRRFARRRNWCLCRLCLLLELAKKFLLLGFLR
jgi:hypothetical protein